MEAPLPSKLLVITRAPASRARLTVLSTELSSTTITSAVAESLRA